jgi:hypothetical protein
MHCRVCSSGLICCSMPSVSQELQTAFDLLFVWEFCAEVIAQFSITNSRLSLNKINRYSHCGFVAMAGLVVVVCLRCRNTAVTLQEGRQMSMKPSTIRPLLSLRVGKLSHCWACLGWGSDLTTLFFLSTILNKLISSFIKLKFLVHPVPSTTSYA